MKFDGTAGVLTIFGPLGGESPLLADFRRVTDPPTLIEKRFARLLSVTTLRYPNTQSMLASWICYISPFPDGFLHSFPLFSHPPAPSHSFIQQP